MSITSTAPANTSVNGHATTGTSRPATSNGQRPPAASGRPKAPSSRPAAHPGVLQLLRQADAEERQQSSQMPGPIAAGSAGGFTAEQVEALAAPLDRSRISSREQGRGRVNYLQSWVVINEANRIFGFDGWQRQTLSSSCVAQAERPIGREQKPGWGVTYTARVRISVQAGSMGLLIREGTGAGHGIDTDLGLAHESAIKEAETDAMKRALVTFGNPFGLALYDKSQRQVTGSTAAGQGTAPGNQSSAERPANTLVRRAAVPQTSTPTRPIDPSSTKPAADAPLDPATIQPLQERIRSLQPPQLAAFSQAFRAAFHVPDAIPSIAGLITEQRHRLWIEQFLSQAQEQSQPGDT